MEAKKAIETVFKKCKIIYNGANIGEEYILKSFKKFLNQTFNEKKHNVSFIMHTGSDCFDAISILFASICTMALDEGKVESILSSLQEEDIVIYKKKKFKFMGITEEKIFSDKPPIKYAILNQDKEGGLTSKVPKTNWFLIEPYRGNAKSLDGRGTKNSLDKRNKFFASMFGTDKEEIPSVFESSVIVVMPRTRADELVKNLKLIDKKEGEEYKLLDLVTVSYYTENSEYRYSGNAGKYDANLKITSKLSVARDLIYQPLRNIVHGLMILGSDGVNQSRTELEELINRRSLKFVYVSYYINSEIGAELVAAYEEASLFSCTKEYLLQNSFDINSFNRYTRELDRQVDIIIDKEVNSVIVPFEYTTEDYKKLRRMLQSIKRTDLSYDNKDDFVIQAMSLLNLLITAPFSMRNLEECITEGFGVLSPSEKVELIEKYIFGFSGELREKTQYVTAIIKEMYEKLYECSPKEEILKKLLSDKRCEKIAIIIPKAYYEKVLAVGLKNYLIAGNIVFFTPNRFDNTKKFDRIIVVGEFSGKRFNAFTCTSAKDIDVLLYSFEQTIFEYKRKAARKTEILFDKRTNVFIDDESESDLYLREYDEAEEINSMILEMNDYIESMNAVTVKNHVTRGVGTGTSLINAVRYGKFAEGDSIVFSKNYKAVVFNEENGEIAEREVDKLDSGDVLVFTKNNSLTKGIVDEILESLLERELLEPKVQISYSKSQYWKKVLVDYVKNEGITYEELGKRMAKQGSTKNYATIRNWIQPFSHIVGPIDEESYFHIAQLTQDDKLLEDPGSYCKDCALIRKERVRILKLIASAIVKKLGGEPDTDDELLKTVYDNIDDLATRRQLDYIADIKDEYSVPIGMINRPISI